MDGNTGHSSYIIDLPDGGLSYIIGNVIQQGPDAENSTLVSYAAESHRNPKQELYVVNNTFVNTRSAGTFIRIAQSGAKVEVINNIFAGRGQVLVGRAQMRNNIVTREPGFVNAAQFDYHLRATSPAVDAGTSAGTAEGMVLRPRYEYGPGGDTVARLQNGPVDVGAYEYMGPRKERRP